MRTKLLLVLVLPVVSACHSGGTQCGAGQQAGKYFIYTANVTCSGDNSTTLQASYAGCGQDGDDPRLQSDAQSDCEKTSGPSWCFGPGFSACNIESASSAPVQIAYQQATIAMIHSGEACCFSPSQQSALPWGNAQFLDDVDATSGRV
jgi:hypothetical protein